MNTAIEKAQFGYGASHNRIWLVCWVVSLSYSASFSLVLPFKFKACSNI